MQPKSIQHKFQELLHANMIPKHLRDLLLPLVSSQQYKDYQDEIANSISIFEEGKVNYSLSKEYPGE